MLAVCSALALACAEASSAPWTPLWTADAASAPLREEGAWGPDGLVLRRDDAGATWLEFPLPAAVWKRGESADTWTVQRPAQLGTLLAKGEKVLLEGGGRTWTFDGSIGRRELAVDSYALRRGQILLRLDPGARPPEGLQLAFLRPEARRAADGWRVELGEFTGYGFSVWTGQARSLRVSFDAERALRFFSVTQDARERGGGVRGAVTIAVELDGKTLFEERQESGVLASGQWRTVALPRAGRRRGELTFRVSGAPALCAILAPAIGPAPAEPSVDPRPSVVLFLADTFRADNLALHGGAADLAPNLNAFAEGSVRCVRAWAPSTWTLPSQSSLLTGLYPEQHAAVEWETGLADTLTTLAERLGDAGYRTGAITDSYCVSRDFGIDQGFEWFYERRQWSLAETLAGAREFLRADDGRPAFLFVQTYRAHMPYRSDDADAGRDYLALRAELEREWKAHGDEQRRRLPAERLRELYQRGVRDLDRQLGEFLRELETSGFLAEDLFVFTSDHGEAFGEHGKSKHSGRPFEEESRIPLLLRGRGLEPRDLHAAASLVDLPRTIAALAGVPPAEAWGGVDLLSDPGDRPVYSFVRLDGTPHVAFVEGERKVHALADPERLGRGEHLEAYDLASDPGEARALDEAWVADLCRSRAQIVAELLTPRASAPRIELSEEDRAHLRAIGYGE